MIQTSSPAYRIVRASYQLHNGWKVERGGQPIVIFFGPTAWTQAILYRDDLQAKEFALYARKEEAQ